MKLSVLFGVLQMVVGVFLRCSNAIHFKNKTDLICECIPMLIFMFCFFGWMDFMILYKWTHPVEGQPSLINSLICMAMGQKDLTPIYPGSVEFSQTLMLFTMLSVPMMLIPKPISLFLQHKAKLRASKKHQESLLSTEDDSTDEERVVLAPKGAEHLHEEHEFEIGEETIHQVIETIEYVLGTVSHTASYLRIWALSLAHQQLSLVFFQKTITMGLEWPAPLNGLVLVAMFFMWFGITCGVLLGMDVLECFLHTLRLHWVEFQSKFYNVRADEVGPYKFAPFNIKKIVETPVDN
jgi:V-type H+-transporting ATPase subunit a